MKFERDTEALRIRVTCDYDKELYRTIWKYRKNPYDNGNPIEDTGTLFYALRRAVNEDPSRIEKVAKIFERHPRIIIFYNFSCELDALRKLFTDMDVTVGEWNGQTHTDIPKCKRWVYLVQYSGAEGWNCITTDTVVFFSQNYSYSITKQAEGRIDRLNTKYKKLYYYYLRSDAPIDQAIYKALIGKKNFNENTYLKNGRKK
jgi:superfamily II DNA or RNA helicase